MNRASFGGRMMVMVSMESVIVDPPAEGVTVDPLAWFDSPGPFELEIGSGKGGFLLSRAKADPGVCLLGIEWANRYFRYAADRLARWQITNVRIMRTDARTFVVHHLPPRCISVLHLYHPDPWPKRRHHRRRLMQEDFVEAAARALAPGGRWMVQSDHAEYFEEMTRLLDERPELKETSWDAARCRVDSAWGGTNYEIKYTREGRPIYRAAYVLSSAAQEHRE